MIFKYGESFFNLSDVVSVKDETNYIKEDFSGWMVIKSKIPDSEVFRDLFVSTRYARFRLTGDTAGRFIKEYNEFKGDL